MRKIVAFDMIKMLLKLINIRALGNKNVLLCYEPL